MYAPFVFFSLFAVIFGQTAEKPKYVFDYYINAPALDSEAVIDLMIDAVPGITFPLNHGVPPTKFDCAKVDGPGYYADPQEPSFCQAFYRCDISGNQTGFLCPNSTLFNQITLACDYYFNVDCGNVTSFYNYGNSRLYQGERPLFDTPPKDYISPLSGFYPEGGQQASVIAARPGLRSQSNLGAVVVPGVIPPFVPATRSPVEEVVQVVETTTEPIEASTEEEVTMLIASTEPAVDSTPETTTEEEVSTQATSLEPVLIVSETTSTESSEEDESEIPTQATSLEPVLIVLETTTTESSEEDESEETTPASDGQTGNVSVVVGSSSSR